jgi:hypothetical protein
MFIPGGNTVHYMLNTNDRKKRQVTVLAEAVFKLPPSEQLHNLRSGYASTTTD